MSSSAQSRKTPFSRVNWTPRALEVLATAKALAVPEAIQAAHIFLAFEGGDTIAHRALRRLDIRPSERLGQSAPTRLVQEFDLFWEDFDPSLARDLSSMVITEVRATKSSYYGTEHLLLALVALGCPGFHFPMMRSARSSLKSYRWPNKAASHERRDCATIAVVARWRGVGEPRRWGISLSLRQVGMAVTATLVMLVGGCTRSRSGIGISPQNQKAVSAALTQLLDRTNEFRFVIFEERSSRKFVQFAASGSIGLQLDLPSQPLNSDELSRAREMFTGLGVAFETWQLLDQPGGIPLRPQSGFQLALSNDVARATALVGRIFREIYGFPSDLDLVIAEN